MKGKKSNIEFVSNFMSQCVQEGKNSPEQILSAANQQLEEINKKIQDLEELKTKRSNLLDVIDLFKKENSENLFQLNLYSLKYPNICKDICHLLESHPLSMSSINSNKYEQQDLIFCIKQLLEYSVISKTGDTILRGDKFKEYLDIFKKVV